jgi:Protein of unknown function (DUF1769)
MMVQVVNGTVDDTTYTAMKKGPDDSTVGTLLHSESDARGSSISTAQFDDDEDLDNLVAVDDRIQQNPLTSNPKHDHYGQHPALETMCVMDCQQKKRIVPNAAAAHVLSNECFEGHVMLLVRTPDVDDLVANTPPTTPIPKLGETPQRVSQYFEDKKRRFEFQFQIRLKKVPKGPLFLGCELEHSIKVGTLTKGLVNILLAMVKRINPGFHYSWGIDPNTLNNAKVKNSIARNEYEKTHLSFPVEASMDRIVITKPGETPPQLGFELDESNESVKRRRKMGAGSVDWNLNDTYTMCLWSAYVDWIKWGSMNVPGVSPFSLSRVTGQQPIYLCVYEITSCSGVDYKKKRPPHLRNQLNVYTRLEFTNLEKTVGGVAETVLNRSAPTNAIQNTESGDGDRVAALPDDNHYRTSSTRHVSFGSNHGIPFNDDVESVDSDVASRVTT